MKINESEILESMLALRDDLSASTLSQRITCIVLEVDVGQGGIEISLAGPDELSCESFGAIRDRKLDPESIFEVGSWKLSSCKWGHCPKFAQIWRNHWESPIAECFALMIRLGLDSERAQFKAWVLEAIARSAVDVERAIETLICPHVIVVEVSEPIGVAFERYRDVRTWKEAEGL